MTSVVVFMLKIQLRSINSRDLKTNPLKTVNIWKLQVLEFSFQTYLRPKKCGVLIFLVFRFSLHWGSEYRTSPVLKPRKQEWLLNVAIFEEKETECKRKVLKLPKFDLSDVLDTLLFELRTQTCPEFGCCQISSVQFSDSHCIIK